MRRIERLLAFLLLGGCASSGLPAIVDAQDVRPASGAPKVTRIRDAGTAMVPREGAIDGVTDNVAGPGELLVVEGDGFGRQPTVTIGARPTEVLARTRGDGLVVRVPTGIDTGLVDIAVSTSGGTGKLAFELRRLAAVVTPTGLRFAAVGKDAVKALASTVELKGARAVRVDSTGGLALVLADVNEGTRLYMVDLGRNAPVVLGSLPITHHGAALTASSLAPRVAIVGEGKVSIVDTTSLRRPVLYDAAKLPKEAHGIRAAALSPDGKVLALLIAEGNRVVALDVNAPTAPQLISVVDVLPGERSSLVRDLDFSPDGQTLWILSGATAETHPQVIPTRITAVKIMAAYAEGGAPVEMQGMASPRAIPSSPIRRELAVWKTQTVNGATAPLALTVGAAPDAQGSAIRSAPEAATIYLTAMKDRLFELKSGAPDDARVRKLVADAGAVARAELGGGGGPVATTHELCSAITVPRGSRRAIALAVHASDTGLELGVDSIPLDGGAAQFAPLTTIPSSLVKPPFSIGDLAVQP